MADIIDPTARPHPNMSRRVFVGLSSGAIAASSAIARALADGTALGAPHPPLVAEDDPVSRRLLEVFLVKWGFDVVLASTDRVRLLKAPRLH